MPPAPMIPTFNVLAMMRPFHRNRVCDTDTNDERGFYGSGARVVKGRIGRSFARVDEEWP